MSLQVKTKESHENSIILQDRLKIKQRINFLQQSLVQLSFIAHSRPSKIERSEVYKNLIHSLKMTKKLLKENHLIQQKNRIHD